MHAVQNIKLEKAISRAVWKGGFAIGSTGTVNFSKPSDKFHLLRHKFRFSYILLAMPKERRSSRTGARNEKEAPPVPVPEDSTALEGIDETKALIKQDCQFVLKNIRSAMST